jgi:tetratricopeptide (TPR) repeat protein
VRQHVAVAGGPEQTSSAPQDKVTTLPRWRRGIGVVVDILLGTALIGILVFPFIALTQRANGSPLENPSAAPARIKGGAVGTSLRSVPVLLQRSSQQAERQAARQRSPGPIERQEALLETSVFGPAGAATLGSLLTTANLLPDEADGQLVYPFRYPAVTAFLTSEFPVPPSAIIRNSLIDLAGLLTIDAGWTDGATLNGTILAYAMLNQVRNWEPTSCVPQLNLAVLISLDAELHYADTVKEFERAADVCGGDPSPLWLLGEYQSGFIVATPADSHLSATLHTFHRLERAFPGSPLGWSGEADADLRQAYQEQFTQPFTARDLFRRAEDLYAHSLALSPHDYELKNGEARAEAGLDDYGDAATLEGEVVLHYPHVAAYRIRAIEYLEDAHHFGAAAKAGQMALASARLPSPVYVYPSPDLNTLPGDSPTGTFTEDAIGPLSVASSDATPEQVFFGHKFFLAATGVAITDYSFIPTYRTDVSDDVAGTAVALIDPGGWCVDGSIRRDQLLANLPQDAVKGLPANFDGAFGADSVPGLYISCPPAGIVRAVGELALGHSSSAIGAASELYPQQSPTELLGTLRDIQQNLYRFGGDDAGAAKVDHQWVKEQPENATAWDRLGEVEFLTRQYRLATLSFRLAVALSNGEDRALETVKEGAAEESAGRNSSANALFVSAVRQARAARHKPQGAPGNGYAISIPANYVIYIAQLQEGTNETAQHDFALAAHFYALDSHLQSIDQNTPGSDTVGPEVLQNNWSVDLEQLLNPRQALVHADAALKIDPNSPIFLNNRAFAERRLPSCSDGTATYAAAGCAPAVAAYTATLQADPTFYPAANDLGGILLNEGGSANLQRAAHYLSGAVAAAHHVGVQYTDAEWNLGIALQRQGWSHVVASQAAFADAVRADHSLINQSLHPIFDDGTYFAHLDLSKPLPANWNFAGSSQHVPVTVGVLAIAWLLLLGGGRAVLTDRAGAVITDHGFEVALNSRLTKLLGTRAHWVIGILVSIAVVTYPLARASGVSSLNVLLLGLSAAVILGAVLRARSAVARSSKSTVRHATVPVVTALGIIATLFTVPYAPLPVAESDSNAKAIRFVAPVMLAALCAWLLVAERLTGVPMTRDLAGAALVMFVSVLTPIKPFDGYYIEKPIIHVILLVSVLAAAISFGIGLI